MNKETKSALGVLLLLIFSILLFILIAKTLESHISIGYFLGGYLLLAIPIAFIASKFKNRYLNVAVQIYFAPIHILYIFMSFIYPAMSILTCLFFFIFAVSLLPILPILVIKTFKLDLVTDDTMLFFYLVSVTIASTIFNKQSLKLVYKYSPLKLIGSSKPEKQKTIELLDYIFTANNIRFTIYLIYFVYIIMYTISDYEGMSFFNSKKIDNVVLQAFLVFLAFDSMRLNSKDFRLLPSELLRKMIIPFLITLDKKAKNDDLVEQEADFNKEKE